MTTSAGGAVGDDEHGTASGSRGAEAQGAAAAVEPPASGDGEQQHPASVEVIDHPPDRRIRKPIDVVRFVAACVGLAMLVGVAFVARRTAAGIESDVLGAGRRLTGALLGTVGVISVVAVVLLMCAIAADHLARRQFGLLAEALAAGGLSVGAVIAVNAILHISAASEFASTLTSVAHGSFNAPLDPFLAGFITFLTVAGGRRGWSGWERAVAVLYVLASLVTRHTTVLGVLITLLLSYAIAVAGRYAVGIPSARPSALDVAEALRAAGLGVTRIARVEERTDIRCYRATTGTGDQLDVTVLDRDQEAGGALYSLYRTARFRSPLSQAAPLSVERAVERLELMSFAVTAAGVATPRVLASVPVGPEAAAVAFDIVEGVPLSARGAAVTDAELRDAWRVVGTLHAHHVTHGALTAERILLRPDDCAALLHPEEGAIAASELAVRLDDAQLLAELSLLAGAGRTAAVALTESSPEDLARTAALLQRVAMQRTTRGALRAHPGLLADLRDRLLDAAPVVEPEPVRLERVSPRSVVSLLALVAGGYLLVGELTTVDLASVLRSVDWRWGVAAVALAAATYAAAAVNLLAFVREQVSFVWTVIAQLASSFLGLVMPAGTGTMSVNVVYLQRAGVPSAAAAASVGVSQVVAFVLHTVLLLVFSVIAGRSDLPLRPPSWAWYVLIALAAVAVAAVALPASRHLLRARLSPVLSQVGPRLLEVVQRPHRLAEGIGGGLALSAANILCLAACIRAVGGSAGFSAVAVVYLTSSALGSIVPTPGGVGAVEAAMTAALTAAGLHSATALAAVLLFRLFTFWLPVPIGWGASKVLERRGAL